MRTRARARRNVKSRFSVCLFEAIQTEFLIKLFENEIIFKQKGRT